MKLKLKMNLKTLEDKIITIVNKSKSKFCIEERCEVEFGLDILNSYLKEIADRAIEINDPIILYDFMQIGVLIPDNAEEESNIEKRFKELQKNSGENQ